jgi:hypothetical protein
MVNVGDEADVPATRNSNAPIPGSQEDCLLLRRKQDLSVLNAKPPQLAVETQVTQHESYSIDDENTFGKLRVY